jgi:ABC-type cobalt transport system substrate-binding protein
MSEKMFRAIGLSALCLIVFVCTLIIIRWCITFVTWSGLDSGWAQAIGTIAAIIGTWAATRYQLRHAENVRTLANLQAGVGAAQIAFDLAVDTHRALRNVQAKLQGQLGQGTHASIGIERLQDLQESLRSLAQRDISPPIFSEILVLKREVAYTLTALRQHNNRDQVTVERVQKATARLMALFEVRQRLKEVLSRAKEAIGDCTPIVEQSASSPETW